tara:strand:+ start:2856 stop:3986 length:1131 start_codon:yes stop_codon:yes gene_type:complete
MAETEKQVEALEKEISEAGNPNASAPTKNAVAAEPSKMKNDAEDLGAPVVKPTDSNPNATKKVSQVSDVVSKSSGVGSEPSHLKTAKEGTDAEKSEKDDKAEAMHDKDEKKKEMKAGYKMESADNSEESYDVKADVDALVGDSDLSEEFKEKAATIFEAAIKSKVKAETAKLEDEYANKLEESQESFKGELSEKVDSYLNYVVEEWMKENEIAIERGIKGEIAEDFIGGLKKLFEDHYIDVPDEKYNVLEDQASKIEVLEKKLNEEIEKNVDLHKSNSELKRQDIIDEMSNDLADTAKEKFDGLIESVEYSTENDFRKKVVTIKESYFGDRQEVKSDDIDDVAAGGELTETVDLSNAMAAYTAAIKKTKDIKLSKK